VLPGIRSFLAAPLPEPLPSHCDHPHHATMEPATVWQAQKRFMLQRPGLWSHGLQG